MKAIQILIVEDEVLIAESIKLYLHERGHCVNYIALSFDEAVEAFHLRRPDLILIDIRLYGLKSGIDLAAYISALKNCPPYIYLTSQYDQRILSQALETNPYGYLTKPIRKETLWTTVESAYNLHQTNQVEQPLITIQDGKNNYNINANDILYVQAEHVYCKIVNNEKKEIIIRKTMKQFVELLAFDFMIFCHRSFIINAKYITSWNQETIFLNREILIPVSRSRRQEIMNKIDQLKLSKNE
ncbi:MAG: response regulator transcription factor [Saprospiraceae bacterium]|nr:response regulator transcription factor [Saprospiraceae bacterium]